MNIEHSERGGSYTGFEVPRRQRQDGNVTWLLLLLVASAAGAGCYHLWQRLGATQGGLDSVQRSLAATRTMAVAVERRAQEADAQLAAARAAFDVERNRLNAELEDYRTRVRETGALTERLREADTLTERLRSAVARTDGDLQSEGGRVTLRLVDRVLFPSGEAELTSAGAAMLARVAEALQAFPDKQVWVQGHTDDARVRHTERFASNWELSTARALAVVHYLQDHARIDPRRLAAVGFGEHRPMSRRNDSHNRRIEIVLFPQSVRVIQK